MKFNKLKLHKSFDGISNSVFKFVNKQILKKEFF